MSWQDEVSRIRIYKHTQGTKSRFPFEIRMYSKGNKRLRDYPRPLCKTEPEAIQRAEELAMTIPRKDVLERRVRITR